MTSMLILLVAGLALVNGLPMKCPVVSLKGGVSYFASKDCERYVTCKVDDVTGRLSAEEMPCGFAQYWDQELLVCVRAEDTVCQNDKCERSLNGLARGYNGNCRAYWECSGGRSIAKCCAVGMRFAVELQACVKPSEGNECNNTVTCLDDGVDISFNETAASNETDASSETTNSTDIIVNPVVRFCPFKGVPNKPDSYYQLIHGIPTERPCPAGTTYDEVDCCVRKATFVRECKPEIHLTFEDGKVKEKSNNAFYVQVKNVDVQNGTGVFNGVNSSIVIPRFNNIEHKSTITVDIKYYSDSLSPSTRGILSNDVGCNIEPSIGIQETDMDVTMVVGTIGSSNMYSNITYVTIPQPDTSDATLKHLLYRFSNNTLTGEVNGQSGSVKTDMYLNSVKCDLTIGAAQNADFFKGRIEELAIYLCDPVSAPDQ